MKTVHRRQIIAYDEGVISCSTAFHHICHRSSLHAFTFMDLMLAARADFEKLKQVP